MSQPVERARDRKQRRPIRRRARELECSLDGLGTGVAKENCVEMRRQLFQECFGQQPAEQRAIHLHHVRQIEVEHIADCFFHHGMVAADVEDGIAAEEIEVGVVIHVVEISAFGSGIDLVETNDALGRDQRPINVAVMQLVVLPEPGRDNLFQVKCHRRCSLI